MKYFILKQLSEEVFSAYGCCANYVRAIRNLGKAVKHHVGISFIDINPDEIVMDDINASDTEKKKFQEIKYRVVRYIRDFHDEKEELDKDKWHVLLIPGVKLSAAIKRTRPSISFAEIPVYYRESVKRYMKTLIYRRSWSFCCEILVYIKYFYKSFYAQNSKKS